MAQNAASDFRTQMIASLSKSKKPGDILSLQLLTDKDLGDEYSRLRALTGERTVSSQESQEEDGVPTITLLEGNGDPVAKEFMRIFSSALASGNSILGFAEHLSPLKKGLEKASQRKVDAADPAILAFKEKYGAEFPKLITAVENCIAALQQQSSAYRQ